MNENIVFVVVIVVVVSSRLNCILAIKKVVSVSEPPFK